MHLLRYCPLPAGGEQHQLRLLKAKSPLGPWEPHLGGLLAAENALTMGAMFKWKNSLHRLGRACRAGQCGGVEVNQVGAGQWDRWGVRWIDSRASSRCTAGLVCCPPPADLCNSNWFWCTGSMHSAL